MKKSIKYTGFTLIELLAVIIILAIIALIATPIVLNVIDSAKESTRKSSVAGYADAVRLAVNEKMFENKGISPAINEDFLNNVIYQGDKVTCNEVKNTNNYGVILKECTVATNSNLYCFAKGKVYSCDDSEFTNIYNNMDENTGQETTYKDGSGANRPVLYTNMIPVKYDGTNWIYADITQKWYDYDSKEWANAVVLNKGTTKNIGDTINVDTDISQMYVWIPRYKYTIFNGNNGTVTTQEINVTFESKTNSTGTVTCTDNAYGVGTTSEECTDATNSSIINGTSTYTHPAFTFGSDNLTGFWIGKFEIANVTACTPADYLTNTNCDYTNLGIQIKPNVKSWRGARVVTFLNTIASISSTYEINADSHMMKNMEWGAVAYLTNSKYGLGTTDIGINNNSNYTTGCGAVAGSASSTTCNAYNTETGKLASTTGNITGVYDMSGGVWEYAMADMITTNNVPMSGNTRDTTAGNSGLAGIIWYDMKAGGGQKFPDAKYFDSYSKSLRKLGDATSEPMNTTSSRWYSDSNGFIANRNPWFIRGGYCKDTISAGIFSSSGSYGSAGSVWGSRVIIS